LTRHILLKKKDGDALVPSPVRIYVLRGKVLLSLAILALVLLTGYRVAAEKLEKHHIATLASAQPLAYLQVLTGGISA
jgi:hypothetical protein